MKAGVFLPFSFLAFDMRWLRVAASASFLTASSSSRVLPSALAFAHINNQHHILRQLSKPLLLSTTLFAHRPYHGSTILAFAANSGEKEDNDTEEGECNATTLSDVPALSEMYDAEYPGTAVQRLKQFTNELQQ